MGNQTPTEPVHHVDTPFERITFGMGCFWGCDCLYGGTRGVLRTRVGYAAGSTPNPTYKNMWVLFSVFKNLLDWFDFVWHLNIFLFSLNFSQWRSHRGYWDWLWSLRGHIEPVAGSVLEQPRVRAGHKDQEAVLLHDLVPHRRAASYCRKLDGRGAGEAVQRRHHHADFESDHLLSRWRVSMIDSLSLSFIPHCWFWNIADCVRHFLSVTMIYQSGPAGGRRRDVTTF